MIERAGVVGFWSILIALALGGAYITLVDVPAPPPGGGAVTPSVRATDPGAAGARVPERPHVERRRNHSGLQLPRRPAGIPEPGPRARDLRWLDRQRARAEPVARRFFAAFSRYELGEVDRRIEAQLRATATRHFAAELRRSPPRTTIGSSSTPRGALGGLEFVAGRLDDRGELRSGELVGSVRRGERRSPIALEVVQLAGEWRVAGVGR